MIKRCTHAIAYSRWAETRFSGLFLMEGAGRFRQSEQKA